MDIWIDLKSSVDYLGQHDEDLDYLDSWRDSRYGSRWKLILIDTRVAAGNPIAAVIADLEDLSETQATNDDHLLQRTTKWRLEVLTSKRFSREHLTEADLVPESIYRQWAEETPTSKTRSFVQSSTGNKSVDRSAKMSNILHNVSVTAV